MQKLIRVVRKVVVDDDVDTLDVDAASEQVRRHKDARVELLEGLVLRNAFLLLLPRVDAYGGEVALGQQAVELVRPGHLGNEDDHLVELEGIEEVVQLSVLLSLGELDVVQLEAMEGELGVIVDVDLHGILAELLAHGTDLLAQRGAEHHNLFLVWGHAKDLLNVATHVERFQNTITFVQNEVLDVVQLERLLPGEAQDTAGRAHHNVRTIILDNISVRLDGDTTVEDSSLHLGKVLGEPLILMSNLEGELSCMTQDQDTDLILSRREGIRIQLMKGCQYKHCCFSHTALSLTYDVHAKYSLRNAFVLYFRWMLKTAIDNRAEAFGFENEVLKSGGMNSYVMTPVRCDERVR